MVVDIIFVQCGPLPYRVEVDISVAHGVFLGVFVLGSLPFGGFAPPVEGMVELDQVPARGNAEFLALLIFLVSRNGPPGVSVTPVAHRIGHRHQFPDGIQRQVGRWHRVQVVVFVERPVAILVGAPSDEHIAGQGQLSFVRYCELDCFLVLLRFRGRSVGPVGIVGDRIGVRKSPLGIEGHVSRRHGQLAQRCVACPVTICLRVPGGEHIIRFAQRALGRHRHLGAFAVLFGFRHCPDGAPVGVIDKVVDQIDDVVGTSREPEHQSTHDEQKENLLHDALLLRQSLSLQDHPGERHFGEGCSEPALSIIIVPRDPYRFIRF